jgi:hypothetical protein
VNNDQKNARTVVPDRQKRKVFAEEFSATFATNASTHLAVSESPQGYVHPYGMTSFLIDTQQPSWQQNMADQRSGFARNYEPINSLNQLSLQPKS